MNDRLSFIAKYIETTDQAGSVVSLKRDLRLSQIVKNQYLTEVEQLKIKDICDRFREILLLIEIILPFKVAIKTGKIDLEDLKKQKISFSVCSAIAELSYYPKNLEDLESEELLEIINQLFC